jgi:hypothetical protein
MSSEDLTHAAQYKLLRAEVLQLVDETRKLELYALGGVAALYAWLVKDGQHVPKSAFYIAVPLVALGGLRALALYFRVKEIGEYQRKLEELYFTSPALPGWERYRKKHGYTILLPTAIAFWALLALMTLVAPWFLKS